MIHVEWNVLPVNYDDTRWNTVAADPDRHINVIDARLQDYSDPRRGHGLVRFVSNEFREGVTPLAVAVQFAQAGLRLPCRAEAETYFDSLRYRRITALHLAICSLMETPHDQYAAVISQHQGGRYLFRRPLSQPLVRYSLILAVSL